LAAARAELRVAVLDEDFLGGERVSDGSVRQLRLPLWVKSKTCLGSNWGPPGRYL